MAAVLGSFGARRANVRRAYRSRAHLGIEAGARCRTTLRPASHLPRIDATSVRHLGLFRTTALRRAIAGAAMLVSIVGYMFVAAGGSFDWF